VAFSVRDVLKLRILAIVGEGLTLPYYYFQHEKLWPPIFGDRFRAAAGRSQGGAALPRRIVSLAGCLTPSGRQSWPDEPQ
jgi:hypothetical protein